MGLNLAVVLREGAKRAPGRTAVKLGDDELSYLELDERSDRMAAYLAQAGVGPGDAVGIMLPNVPAFAVAYYGTLKTGAAVVPMNVLLRGREVKFHLRDSGAKALVVWHEVAREAVEPARALGIATVVVAGGDAAPEGADSFDDAVAAVAPVPDVAQRDPSDAAVILYTSGTTGTPKGAVLTHSSLLWNAELSAELFALGPQDRLLGTLPLFHSFGQTCVLNAGLRAGSTVVLMARFEPEAALDLIEGEPITVFLGVPTMYVGLLNAESAAERDVGSLRLCVSGGAAIAGETLRGFEERFGCRVLEGYGLSETSPVASFNHLDRPSKPGSIGTPLWGTDMRVADPDGQTKPAGEVGEILIRGHNVMREYWRRPEQTAEAIDADGWLHTGDLARVDEDGYFFIVDRMKDMIIRGGYNVYPREVEEVLYEHPGVLEAAVVGVPHDVHGEEVAAAVVAKPGSQLDPMEVRAYVKDRVAAYKYPRVVAIVDELPKGPTGKIVKREIDAALFETATAAAAGG